MKKTVPGLARIQNTLNSGESSYDSWCITIRGAFCPAARLTGHLAVER